MKKNLSNKVYSSMIKVGIKNRAGAKAKGLLPSLREKKRYVVFEVISNHGSNFSLEEVEKTIGEAGNGFIGKLGMAKAGLLFLDDWKADKYNGESEFDFEIRRGVARVSANSLDALRASFCFIGKINKQDVVVRSVGVSGALQKARRKFLRN